MLQEPLGNLTLGKAQYYLPPPSTLAWRTFALVVPSAIVLFWLARHNYLLFHTLVEFFYVTVAFTIFSIGWNSRHFVSSNSLMVLALGHLAVAPLQTFHLLSYQGMNILPIADANPATQLWIAARYLEALVFLSAALLLKQRERIHPYLMLGVALASSALLLGLIWPLGLFPDCFLPGQGLTGFKVTSEYVVCLLLGGAILLLWRHRERLDRRFLVLLLTAIALSALSELVFTLYHDIYGLANFFGHFFKLAAVVFLYRALISVALRTPYSVLFNDLSRAKEELDHELDQRRQTERELREANRELDAFVRTVSHDLRSPLTPIIGLAGILQERLGPRLEHDELEALKTIENQGQRMSRILTDLLAFARAGHAPVEELDLAPLDETLDRVLEDLGSRLIVARMKVLRTPLPDSRYPRTFIFQMLSNLVGNALKYAAVPDGIIEISGEWQGDNHVLLRVADHGPGIPEQERKKVFELFHRQRCHVDLEGSGIGLATVKKIVERLSGQVIVENTPGGGATFVIELPPFDAPQY